MDFNDDETLATLLFALEYAESDETRGLVEKAFGYLRQLHVNDVGLNDSNGICNLPLMASHLRGADFSYREYFKKARTVNRLLRSFSVEIPSRKREEARLALHRDESNIN